MAQIIANNNGGGGGGGGGSYTPGNGIDITGSKISIDEDVVQTKDNLVTDLDDADNDHYPSALAVKNAISSGGGGDVSGPSSSVDGDIAVFDGNTGKIIKDGNKKLSDYQEKLTPQTAYTSKGTSAKVAQITTNTLGQVTNVTEVDIDYPSQVDNTAYGSSWDGVTGTAPSKNAVYDKINSIDTDISTINGKIPSEASSSNKLADKDYVNDSINSVTAYYITKNAAGDQFATYAELAAATTFYSGGVQRTPTRNDYCIVAADENHDNATTRYIYNSGWEFQYVINETALTTAQINALNSGITSGKVSTYDGYAATIAGKQDALTAQTAYTNEGTSTKVAQISTNSLGQVTNITEQSIAFPVTSVNGQKGDITINEGITKVFTLSSTSDLVNAQAAYDRIIGGGNAQIKVGSDASLFSVGGVYGGSVRFCLFRCEGAVSPVNVPLTWALWYSYKFTISSGEVTAVDGFLNNINIGVNPPTSGTNATITLVI